MMPDDVKDMIRSALQVARKRKALCRNPLKCPECGSVQVQLKNWTQPGKAEWKCRTDCGCGHRWVVDDPMIVD